MSNLEPIYLLTQDRADGVVRHPLQILKIFKSSDLRKAKHKASGGRGISGMTAPKKK